MKIAVTADVHLVPGSDGHPERLAALRDILGRLPGLGVEQLIIAGDLFDRAPQGYGEFDALCEQHPAGTLDVSPGNHDANLADGHLVMLPERGELVLGRATADEHQELARFDAIDGKTWNVPALVDGRLFLRNAAEMAAFDVRP